MKGSKKVDFMNDRRVDNTHKKKKNIVSEGRRRGKSKSMEVYEKLVF